MLDFFSLALKRAEGREAVPEGELSAVLTELSAVLTAEPAREASRGAGVRLLPGNGERGQRWYPQVHSGSARVLAGLTPDAGRWD